MLARNAIPVLHSCAAMLKIAEMEYSGANSIFIRLEKLKSHVKECSELIKSGDFLVNSVYKQI